MHKLEIITRVDRATMRSSSNIMTNLSSSADFSILVNAIKTAGLTDKFSGNDLFTFFAPGNKAFEKLPAGILDTLLLPSHKTELVNLIFYHALAGIITSKDLEKQIKAGNGQATLTTLAGGKVTASINENRNIVLTDESGLQSVISHFDIKQSNGTLDVITSVLSPHSE